MTHKQLTATTIVLAILTGVGIQQASAKKGGTDILHYTVSANLTGEADGEVVADVKTQGNAAKQSLLIDVSGLEADTAYQLQALINGDTNLVHIADFTTDANGDAQISYGHKGQGKGNSGGDPLPNEFDPVTVIDEIDIVNASTQVVATANMANPDSFQYLVKRGLDNDGAVQGASGSLRLKGHNQTEQFRLRADGLSADTDYLLQINDAILSTLTSDSKGRINSGDMPNGAPSILEIENVQLLDGSTNSVLSTTLP